MIGWQASRERDIHILQRHLWHLWSVEGGLKVPLGPSCGMDVNWEKAWLPLQMVLQLG